MQPFRLCTNAMVIKAAAHETSIPTYCACSPRDSVVIMHLQMWWLVLGMDPNHSCCAGAGSSAAAAASAASGGKGSAASSGAAAGSGGGGGGGGSASSAASSAASGSGMVVSAAHRCLTHRKQGTTLSDTLSSPPQRWRLPNIHTTSSSHPDDIVSGSSIRQHSATR